MPPSISRCMIVLNTLCVLRGSYPRTGHTDFISYIITNIFLSSFLKSALWRKLGIAI
jgi:hypothetical protein